MFYSKFLPVKGKFWDGFLAVVTSVCSGGYFETLNYRAHSKPALCRNKLLFLLYRYIVALKENVKKYKYSDLFSYLHS